MLENIKNVIGTLRFPQIHLKKSALSVEKNGIGKEINAIQPYDAAVHGDIVNFNGIPGYVETERYWVNEPFSFISIQFNETTNDYIYCIAEPELTPFEVALLCDIYERSS